MALRRGYRACALGPPISPWEWTKLPLLSLPKARRSLPTLASWPTPKQSSFLPQGTDWSFIPSNVPVKIMILGVQIVYKDGTTAKLSEAGPRVSASVFLTEEKQMKKKKKWADERVLDNHVYPGTFTDNISIYSPNGRLMFQMKTLRLREVQWLSTALRGQTHSDCQSRLLLQSLSVKGLCLSLKS